MHDEFEMDDGANINCSAAQTEFLMIADNLRRLMLSTSAKIGTPQCPCDAPGLYWFTYAAQELMKVYAQAMLFDKHIEDERQRLYCD